MENNNEAKRSKREERGFKGVWIPAYIYLDPNLSALEKLLIIEIDSLDNDEEKGCRASNEYLAKFIGKSPGTTKNMITKLKKNGYIEQCYFDGRNRGLRVLKSASWSHVYVRAGCTDSCEQDARIRASSETHVASYSVKNNSSKNKSKKEQKSVSDILAEKVIFFLNEMTGRRFRPEGKTMLFARCREGYTLEQFKDVIALKCAEWLNTEQEKYLRPETLFNKSKFIKYLEDVQWLKENPAKQTAYFNQQTAKRIGSSKIEALRDQIASSI